MDYSVSGGLQGAAGGAMAGSVIPGVGTALGAGIGGLLGLFGGDGGRSQQQSRLNSFYGDVNGRQAPQAGAASQSAASPYESNRAALIAQLQAQAMGQGPSLAANQMREAMDRSAGAQGALAAGAAGRGVNPGAAYANAANQTSAIQSQGARDTANARVQEQYNAQGLLGNTLDQGIGQGLQNNQFNAMQQNQVMLANLTAKINSMQIDDATKGQLLQMLQGNVQPGMGQQILAGGAMAGSYFAGAQGAGSAAKAGQAGGGQGGYGNMWGSLSAPPSWS